ncbi:hypothetical protein [Thiofaba sp. EF100]|uniref:hypothetical protein n=1 Tax=Thiofaba sp. EF100 TaxID=3121274 RepID=UPI00322176E7
MTPRVPQRFVGLWHRRLLETPAVRDTSTEVFWLQTPTLYVDLRVPLGRQAPCEGFAGRLTVDGDVLTWQRWLDLSPPSPWPDVGTMHGEGDLLEEFGVYQPYREVWQRVAHGGDSLALVWEGEGAGRGIWVMLGRYFMWALFRHEGLSLHREISYGLRGEEGGAWTILRSSEAALVGTSLADRYHISMPKAALGDCLLCDRGTGQRMRWRPHA